MEPVNPSERIRSVLTLLARASSERTQAEAKNKQDYTLKREAERKRVLGKVKELSDQTNATIAKLEAEFTGVRQEHAARFGKKLGDIRSEYDNVTEDAKEVAKESRAEANKRRDESRWEIDTVYDAQRGEAKREREELEKRVVLQLDRLAAFKQRADRFCDEVRQPKLIREDRDLQSAVDAPDTPESELKAAVEQAEAALKRLEGRFLPKLYKGHTIEWLLTGLWVISIVPCIMAFPPVLLGIGVSIGFGLLAGFGIFFAGMLTSRNVTANAYGGFCSEYARGRMLAAVTRMNGDEIYSNEKRRLKGIRDDDYARVDETHRASVNAANNVEREALSRFDRDYPARLEVTRKERDAEAEQIADRYPRKVAAVKTEARETHEKMMADMEAFCSSSEAAQAVHWNQLTARWQAALESAKSEHDGLQRESNTLHPDWPDVCADPFKPSAEVPGFLRFGELVADPAKIPNFASADPRLAEATLPPLAFPAVTGFPRHASILVKAADQGRQVGLDIFRSLMLRMLHRVPPSKVRFTIIDPVGLGQNFAGFMHLADHDEQFVTSRIWTEPQQIEERLTDLTQHMENVIQKYLRNDFETIEQYNEMAGEVAEPYRVVVIANFPVNFNETSLKRLVSIVSTGHRCGVLALILNDTRQPMTIPTVSIKDLEAHCVNLAWSQGKLLWKDIEFEKWELKPDAPPSDEEITSFVKRVGKVAKEMSRVEVPFDMVAPKPDRWWSFDTRGGISVPLGRAGATRLQPLALGKGTSQHVLVAGKTGSGKSTLFHALITNAALMYSPEELELYLIDFKKGVEFKIYANRALPHAKVIAIESEREFGLSVLQRLDAELRNRAEEYRKVGEQDVAGFREKTGRKMPRILLVVDEFQEFFVEDDRIAQEVSLLMDRLVRQGRAFGIHVILGSQTLGGAYSLPRSTLGQMAVRIALQCAEADAHMVLAEDNPAARLLTRPGEAIYNEANGVAEGNNFFQVVWLSDRQQDDYLARLHERAGPTAEPAIVFEGNQPAEFERNPWIRSLLAGDAAASPRLPTVWLGDAIAIKDPTAAIFRPQTASNLAILGQNPEGAIGIISSALVALSSQARSWQPAEAGEDAETNGSPDHVSLADIHLLDGTPADSSKSGALLGLAEKLPNVRATLSQREAGAFVQRLEKVVKRRLAESSGASFRPTFLVIHDLQRFRDLRKPEDDFSFGRSGGDDVSSPGKALQTILKEGSAVGVHVIVWCDSMANFQRVLDRNGIKDFDMRVLFQMSNNDSSTLIDSPAASRLGFHRAFLHIEDEGRLEKFRPYALPEGPANDRLVEAAGSAARAVTAT